MRSLSSFILVFSSCLLLARGGAAAATTTTEEEKKKTPPPFFLQDPTDSLCLAGEEFKRCSIDTLFYVTGAPGMCCPTQKWH